MPSISDDDLCSGCGNCTYNPGASSSCKHDFPGSPDEDGYIVRCADFMPMPITMAPEQVQAAIAGHDLKTCKGWLAAARALLADKPAGTAIKDGDHGYTTLIDGDLCCLAGFRDGRTTYETKDGIPVDGCDPDVSAWDDERGCWDGLESAEQNMCTLTNPVFCTLTFIEGPLQLPQAGAVTQLELVRAAVQAKMAHWDALCALERSFANELSDRQNDAMCEHIDLLAASANGAISNESAQEVLNAIASA